MRRNAFINSASPNYHSPETRYGALDRIAMLYTLYLHPQSLAQHTGLILFSFSLRMMKVDLNNEHVLTRKIFPNNVFFNSGTEVRKHNTSHHHTMLHRKFGSGCKLFPVKGVCVHDFYYDYNFSSAKELCQKVKSSWARFYQHHTTTTPPYSIP